LAAFAHTAAHDLKNPLARIVGLLKYGGQPPRVELGAQVQPDEMVRFWVQDTAQAFRRAPRAGPSHRSRDSTRFARKGMDWGFLSCDASWKDSVDRREWRAKWAREVPLPYRYLV
jgi:hypothetical protein